MRKQLAVTMMHQTWQSGWEKCEKFKTVILKSNPHWYLHWIFISIFDTNSSKHLNVGTEAHAMTPEPCSGRKCSQSLSKSQRSGCLCSAQGSASLTPQAYNLIGPFSPLPLCNISNTTNIPLHMVFPASPTWHSRHATLTVGTCPGAHTSSHEASVWVAGNLFKWAPLFFSFQKRIFQKIQWYLFINLKIWNVVLESSTQYFSCW